MIYNKSNYTLVFNNNKSRRHLFLFIIYLICFSSSTCRKRPHETNNIQSDKKGRFEFEVNEGWWAISRIFHVIDGELLPLLITGSMWPLLLRTRRVVSPSSTRWSVIGLYVSSDYASLVKANELCSFYILRKFWGFYTIWSKFNTKIWFNN